MGVILNLFQNLPIVSLVVAVILESRSPGSVVINEVENDRYWTETFQYDLLDNSTANNPTGRFRYPPGPPSTTCYPEKYLSFSPPPKPFSRIW